MNHSSNIDFMKFYIEFTKEPFPFLVNDTTLPSDNSRTYYEMTVSEKIKIINNKYIKTNVNMV